MTYDLQHNSLIQALEELLAEIEPSTYGDGIWTEEKIAGSSHEAKESYARFFDGIINRLETDFIRPTKDLLGKLYHQSPDYRYINDLHKRLTLVNNHFAKLRGMLQNNKVDNSQTELFKKHVQQRGAPLYHDKRMLIALVADIFACNSRLCNTLKIIIEIGAAREVSDLLSLAPSNHQIRLRQITYNFSEQYGINQEWVQEAVEVLAYGLMNLQLSPASSIICQRGCANEPKQQGNL